MGKMYHCVTTESMNDLTLRQSSSLAQQLVFGKRMSFSWQQQAVLSSSTLLCFEMYSCQQVRAWCNPLCLGQTTVLIMHTDQLAPLQMSDAVVW